MTTHPDKTYFICGIDDCKGTDQDDSSYLKTYFELGWEVPTTHFYAKHLLKEGKIKARDVIVTCSGREFLYSETFQNVITWSDYKLLNGKRTISLVDLTIKGGFHSYYDENGIYKYCCTDREIICQYQKTFVRHLHENSPFNVIVYRSRSHDDNRNTDAEYIQDVINVSSRKFKTFVVGYGSEKFENCISVSLQQFCSLISSDFCCTIFTPQTGLAALSRVYSKADLIINYSVDEVMPDGNHPIINGYPQFFINSKILKIPRLPTVEEFELLLLNY